MLQKTAFISHGAPNRVLHSTTAARFIKSLGSHLGTPKALVVVSSHWYTEHLHVTASCSNHKTLHDERGFEPELKTIEYPAPQPPAMTETLCNTLGDAGFLCLREIRGLDHGVWSVLKLAYPKADIPVLELSLPRFDDWHEYLKLGEALRPLREQGFAIIGSGSATYNLEEISEAKLIDAWAAEFTQWLNTAVEKGDDECLVNMENEAPHSKRAHPTPEHFLPLLIAMGAANDHHGQAIYQGIEMGALSNASYVFN